MLLPSPGFFVACQQRPQTTTRLRAHGQTYYFSTLALWRSRCFTIAYCAWYAHNE